MTAAATAASARAGRPKFYVWMATICALALPPLGDLPRPTGCGAAGRDLRRPADPLSARHAVLALDAVLRRPVGPGRQRAAGPAPRLGIAGVSIATAMVLFGFGAALDLLRHGIATGNGPAVKAFLVVADPVDPHLRRLLRRRLQPPRGNPQAADAGGQCRHPAGGAGAGVLRPADGEGRGCGPASAPAACGDRRRAGADLHAPDRRGDRLRLAHPGPAAPGQPDQPGPPCWR